MYDQTDGGKQLRKYCGLTLAWWHNYKHTAFLIWETYANELFAPLWQVLYPGVKFYGKTMNNFPHCIAMFQMLKIAYRELAPDVRTLLRAGTLGPKSQLQLQELHFILAYAIPTVRVYTIVIVVIDVNIEYKYMWRKCFLRKRFQHNLIYTG